MISSPSGVVSEVTTSNTTTFTDHLSSTLGSHAYDMWFRDAKIDVQEDRVAITTPTRFEADWITGRFARTLQGAAQRTLGEHAVCNVRSTPPSPTEPSSPPARPGHSGTRDGSPAPPDRRRSGGAPVPALAEFVVGPSNQLAFAAASAIAHDDRGPVASELMIHGPCGVGKTHLLRGMVAAATRRLGRRRVMYTTGEQFTNEFIASLHHGSIDQFRRRYRRLAVLAIDDVHFFSSKERTQSEFQHTFDAISLKGAAIVMASDEHPSQIRSFNESLVSRLTAGMVAPIDHPGMETRTTLVHRLSDRSGLELTDDAVTALVMMCDRSARQIEGAVAQLAAMVALSPERSLTSINAGHVRTLLRGPRRRPRASIRPEEIIEAVAARVRVGASDIQSPSRHRRVVVARGLASLLARELTTASYPEIAHAMGRRHHSSIHAAAKRTASSIASGGRLLVEGAGEERLEAIADDIRGSFSGS